MGSPFYVCPDMLEGNYDLKCDVWAVGIIAYQMLCGHPPFIASKEPELYKMIKHHSVTFHDQVWQNVSPEACDFIRQLLKKQGVERPSANKAL